MRNDPAVLTTGEVARICHVAPRTVSKWFDSGRLKGYRVPGSPDRRVPRENLVAFLAANGMPTIEELTGMVRMPVALSGNSFRLQYSLDGEWKYVVDTATQQTSVFATLEDVKLCADRAASGKVEAFRIEDERGVVEVYLANKAPANVHATAN